ncbi:MAG: hypothetical protein Sylvanvirus4_29 [Sylvanvirus sp.]|uniref:Uncharacterized protein n=1 Tax=Sylvanvirus sp. TaxID=2487774 RepID=A0A3G5AHD0_9VIRU|nr:MAG: hypothetical protein Sylvanvirus4_29 [Sylvanvirus sp.]
MISFHTDEGDIESVIELPAPALSASEPNLENDSGQHQSNGVFRRVKYASLGLLIAGCIACAVLIPCYLRLVQPNELRLNYIKSNTEQLLGIDNQTISCGQDDCLRYIFSYGIINSLSNQPVVSTTHIGTCMTVDVYCLDSLQTIFDAQKKYLHYDERYPQDTFTTDGSYVSDIEDARRGGIALMCAGGITSFFTLLFFFFSPIFPV